jgi:molybdopterin converting factor small subunit
MIEKIPVRLFGIFSEFEPGSVLQIETHVPTTVGELKQKIREVWAQREGLKIDVAALLKTSALATEEFVLKDRDAIEAGARLALLPPVCGG